MIASIYIAREEWRLFLRSKVAVNVLLTISFIVAFVSIINSLAIMEESHQREHQQTLAQQTFWDQPDRHPHRMVHYGHYAFRTPPPLAIFDPGVDSLVGQSMFLEGHRQNTSTFANSAASADIGSFQGITPAFVYQILLPLLLIALGSGAFTRERETNTLIPMLAQGVSGTSIYIGKLLALGGLVLLNLIPLVILVSIAIANGESWVIGASVILGYTLYLFLWCNIIALTSAKSLHHGIAMGLLIAIWLFWCLIIPRVSVASASNAVYVESKIESDMLMNADLRKLGDGHNANDPAFLKLRAELLNKYNVEDVEDLPVNFRGIVAATSEKKLTDVMNQYANQRMQSEKAQANHAKLYGWLSPTLAIGTLSQVLSGSDLDTHHRFLIEAEKLRYAFVQGLNQRHADTLDYKDDINRNKSPEASKKARISAKNWDVLEQFEFTPSPADQRIAQAQMPLTMLFVWFVVLFCAGISVSWRLIN